MVSVALCVAAVLFLHLPGLLTAYRLFSSSLKTRWRFVFPLISHFLTFTILFPWAFPGTTEINGHFGNFYVYSKAGCCLSAAAPGPVANVSGCLWNSIMLVLYRKTSTAFVRLARMCIIAKEAVGAYGKLNQTPKMNWRLASFQFCSLGWDL